ncbi:AAA family ATPase [Sorangium sp. So ce1036]|uniref:AAA family ATPase n=1 Tax=Sorangium sp. So ce1036 TaxID=3133328 RepID=UPI003F0EF3A5
MAGAAFHVPRFTITSEIQQGSDAVLYRGHRDADRAPVVIKLPRSDRPDPKVLAKLRHEHGILKDLSLTGVVRTHGLEKHGGGLALILEDFGGTPLNILLKTRRLDLESTLRIASSVADALASIHRHGVIHKDIKPHNILVRPDTWSAQLIDFGIATRLSRETQGAGRPDTLEGTLAYMSPEQTGRMNRVLDDRTDLYSFGVTLYEMLTGALPFPSTDPVELVHSHIARRPVPPHEVSPETPRVVSDIVMKLLSKAAEDRYETASGLKADLDECLATLSSTGRITPFPLGRHDRSGKLRLPQRLYGREAEVAALGSAWQRATQGAAELLLVSGYAGVGKSALIQEIHQLIARDGGDFIAGKFDQLDRGTPYAPIAHAFRELVRKRLAEPREALAGWKRRLQLALGANGQLLVDLVPELEFLVGPQPSVPPLGPTESQNRFALLFQRFLRAIATRDRPLAVFLDDLQWIDPASLNLIEQMMSDPDRGHLLVLAAYRDNEVDGAHPLTLTLERLRKAGAAVSEIGLGPLSLPDATQLVADALGCDKGPIAPLAALVWDKTHGNPFFLNQFLGALEQEELLAFDAPSGRWTWDIERIRRRMVTDNVVDFMAGKILRLPERTRHALSLAACMGHRFDLSSLSILCERSPAEVAADLWEALREGLVLPLHAEYRFLDGRAEQDAAVSEMFHVAYRFVHDRVQQAAYSLVGEAEKQAAHLRIGRLLRARSDAEPRDETLFEIANHLNLGAALIEDPGERRGLARLDLAAGRKAKASAAYQAAAGYFRAGLSLLGATAWEEEHALVFALHMERAECEYAIGAFDAVESSLDPLLGHAKSQVDVVRVRRLSIAVCCARNQFERAIEVGRAALSRFGIELPETPEACQAAADAEIARAQAMLVGRRIEDLLHAPLMTDPDKKAAMPILRILAPVAYMVDARLVAFIMAREMTLSLQYGLSEQSPGIFGAYAVLLSGWLSSYEQAYKFARLALDLCERFNAVEQRCQVSFIFGQVNAFWRPLRSSLDHFEQAIHAGLESGDLIFLAYSAHRCLDFRLGLGDELGAVEAEADRYLALMQRTKTPLTEVILRISKQMIANLAGRTRGRATLSDEAFDEGSFVATLGQPGMTMAAAWYYAVKMQLATLYGEHEEALAMARLGDAQNAVANGTYAETDRVFFLCLAQCGSYPARPAAEQREIAERLADHQRQIAEWAESCPENFLHKKLLVEAERARIEGDELRAMGLYDAAIEAAGQNEFFHHEALASELAARFHLKSGRKKIASGYMRDAIQGYLRWGATAKAAALAEEHPHLSRQPAAAPAADGVDLVTRTTTGRGSAILDTVTISRAAQTIAGEIVLERIIDRLLRLVIEHAGAQRGVLLLQQDGRLTLDATITIDPHRVTIGPPVPAETSADVALSVVHYVERTREPVVLGDASSEGCFAGDPYIAERRPRSLLCLPMMHKGELTGLLYLENNAATEVFTPARLDLCALLSAQAAIAVENARLVARAEAAARELGRVNEALEDRIAHRTAELHQANERLVLELRERERAEQERAALQEEIIRVQTERLSEMSTPLIPITDRVMVMPLIGTVDEARARQVIETTLDGAQRCSAAVVIIDITGVKVVDTHVAAMLVRAATALRLIGAQAVLTGMRPEVARTFVELDVALQSIVVKGSLQSGIAFALHRLGQDRLR